MGKFSVKTFLIITLCLWLGNAERDFQFENASNDGTHMTLTEAPEEHTKTVIHKSTYFKEISQCPYSESKIILSLVLNSYDWDSVVENKKTRALHKLSKFFAVPKDYIQLASVSRREIYEMTKRSIKRGINKCENGRSLGKIDLMIGCGQSYFTIGEPISNQIGQQMKDGFLNDITGLNFGWWVIWKKKVSNRVQRYKRQTEGSGEDDYFEYDEYDEDEDGEDTITEIPPVTTSHAHRHHHGVKKLLDDTTVIAYTDESITNVENRTIIKSSTSITDFTSPPVVEQTEPDSTTFSSFVTKKNEAEQTTSARIESSSVPTTTPKSVTSTHSSTSESIQNKIADDNIVELSTIVPESETTVIQNETSTPSATSSTTQSTTTTISTTTTTQTTTTTTSTPAPTEYIEPEPVNLPPVIKNRLPKQPVTAGKPFSLTVPIETFYDNEDGTDLKLELFDKNGNALKPNSWIQFDADKRQIYGLPLEDSVSRWQYKLTATDSKNESVTETLDITVQQHKGHRSVNHEITIAVKLNTKFLRNIDWQIRLIRGIVETLNDNSMSSVVVREIRQSHQDPYSATFVYTNETLPKDKCAEEKLDELVKRLDYRKLTDSLLPELSVKSVTAQPIGPCQKPHIVKPKPTPHLTKNYPPVPRNQVDRVNATIGHLLVYKVPADTFYDPEDTTDLKLSLLTMDRSEIKSTHWLQFDSKNQEFFGIPKGGDYGSEEYLLVAEDHEGLTATDALVVVVNHPPKREYSVLFKVTLGIPYENFNNAYMQRKFIERLAQVYGDSTPSHIQIRSIQHLPDGESIMISFYNTTMQRMHHRCPHEEIEILRNVWFYQDSFLRDKVKKIIGSEFNILGVSVNPIGSCNANSEIIHDKIPIRTEDKNTPASSKDDYLLTFVLPAILILAMVLLASIIACVLHRRRLTGKMELGDEEERRSFRSKGIPVIFQDELDEKPELGNKPPIILKDEKPPLLPPSYNSTNLDGDNDVDEYVPPPAVVMGGREVRGKSPVTPSYRKPPPYVSP